jgi:hypothetical protein
MLMIPLPSRHRMEIRALTVQPTEPAWEES